METPLSPQTICCSASQRDEKNIQSNCVLAGLNQPLEVFATFTLQCCNNAWQPEDETEYAVFLIAELEEMEIVQHFKS